MARLTALVIEAMEVDLGGEPGPDAVTHGADRKGVLFSTAVSSPATLNPAVALNEAGLLGAYFTTMGLPEGGALLTAAEEIDRLLGTHLTPQLRRRAVAGVPGRLVHSFPMVDAARTLLSRAGWGEDRLSSLSTLHLTDFDRRVSRRVADFAAVYAFHGAAAETFAAAKARGAICIYGIQNPPFNKRQAIDLSEIAKYPFLQTPGAAPPPPDAAFTAALQREWDLADLIIANSQFTLDSFRESGVDVSKGVAIPLGFPPPCDPEEMGPKDNPDLPLRALWAGSFSVRKGAHYLLMALRSLDETKIETRVFGKQALPPRALAALPTAITFRQTLPMAGLMEEYRRADVLVIPTLSDGFAMVISEAMSQGVPVITTDQAGASSFIRSGENGLIIPAADAVALAEALDWCFGNRDALREMGEAARLTAQAWQWSDYRAELGRIVGVALELTTGLVQPTRL